MLTLVSFIAVIGYYAPARSTAPIALVALSPYFTVFGIFGIVLFAISGGRIALLGSVAAVASLVWSVCLRAPMWVAATPPTRSTAVVVMTSNLRLGQADPRSVIAAVRDFGVGILMVEELTPQARARLRAAGLDRLLPYSRAEPDSGASGTGLWSRWPLRDARARDDFAFAFISADVAVPRGPVLTAMALHMHGPTPSAGAWDGDITHLRSVLQRQMADHPVVMGGDFNATPDQVQFRDLLTNGFADAADQAGAGYTPTYPADRWFPPLLTIDHVLVRDATATETRTVTVSGSDHRALVVTVRYAPVDGSARAGLSGDTPR